VRRNLALVFCLVSSALAACAGGKLGPAARLPAIEALPPPNLPSWISSVSPLGTRAQTLAQVRVIFAKPVAPVGALEGGGPSELLSHLRVEPALRGHFVVFTPMMIGFVAEQALPIGTRIRVTLTSGLRDLSGDALSQDLAWTFESESLKFTNLPQPSTEPYADVTAHPYDVHPTLQVTSNAEVDTGSLGDHAALTANGSRVPLDAKLEAEPTPYPGSDAAERFDPSLKTWIYDLQPKSDLAKATTYRLSIDPGVLPANGNVPTQKMFSGGMKTYGPLTATIPSPSPSTPGRFAGGDPYVAFSNPVDPETVPGNITLSPAPQQSPASLVSVSSDGTSVAIDPYVLNPDSSYTLSVGATIRDVFGQTLSSPQTFTIQTKGFAPGFWAPEGVNVFPSRDNVALNVYGTNVSGDRYRAAFSTLSPSALITDTSAQDLLPAEKTWPAMMFPNARHNVQSVVRLPVAQRLGSPNGVLAYGVAASTGSSEDTTFYGMVQLTNLGVFAQWFPQRGSVLVQHLSDGSPVANAQIDVYVSGNSGSAPCGGGRTNSGGEMAVVGADVQRCYAGGRAADEAPELFVVAREGADWAYVRTLSYGGVSKFDVYSGWSNGQPLSRGTIFTDRDMYQPGERAQITGIAYYVRGDNVVADRNATYTVELHDPDNNATSIGTAHTNAFGTFSMPIKFGANQRLGYYSIVAKGGSGNEIDGSLRVAEFKPPNFKMDLSLDAKSAPAGGHVTASAKATYLFGAPLDGGKGHVYVTRDTAALAPKGWDEYSFGRQWFWPEQPPSFSTDVMQRDVAFDKDGALQQQVDVESTLPFPMTYSVDVEATDVSHLSVSSTQTFTALPADAIIGLKTDFVGESGKPFVPNVIVTDVDGKPIGGRGVHLELQQMSYAAASQLVAGGESAQNAVQYKTVATADVTSGDQPVTASLVPDKPGSYRLRATFAGASDASATDQQVFAVGPGENNWGAQDVHVVQVKLDKKTYKVGDVARALVASPFANSDIYFSVVRASALYRTIVHAGGAANISFRVTPDMRPNAAVEALVVRRGKPLSSGAGKLDSLAKIGLTAMHVDLGDRYLKVSIAPQQASLEPGTQQHVAFHVHDAAGKPAAGEVVAMVVNEAILQLSGYRPPDLVQMIFADQPISTRFGDSRDYAVLQTQTPPLEKGWGYGGGFLGGAQGTRVRTNFKPMAYYGVIATDAGGNASATFTLPDDLTTWRVLAVAIGQDDAHFGNSDATFIATKPLVTNPLLPQFARPGDRIEAGVSVANQGSAGTAKVSAQLQGALTFASGDPQKVQQDESAQPGIQAFRFPMIVGTPAPTTLQFTTALGSASDAFRVPFLVSDRATTEAFVDSGATAKSTSIPIDLSRGGTLQVTIANSVVPQFAVPAEQELEADPFPFADGAASRAIVASALGGLAPKYKLNLSFDPKTTVADNVTQLMKLQRDDGGFASYRGARESDPFDTAYAVQALAFVRDHGGSVSASALGNAKAYLAKTLADPARYRWCATPDCRARLRFEMLWALDALGDRRSDFMSDILAQADNFDQATQIRVARYLLRLPGWQSQGNARAQHLMQILYMTGRYANANVADRWGWLGSQSQAQAQMLQLLLERGSDVATLDGAVRALVAQQCNCGWPTLDDTAAATQALTAFAAREHLSPMSVTVTAGGATVATAQFGSTAGSKTVSLPASSVHGPNVTVQASGGTAHYIVLYTYPVPGNSPGQLAGVRVIRDVRPANVSQPIVSMDLASLGSPVEVDAGNVYDIGVRVIVDHPLDRLIIDDSLPAGMEAVDTTFRTTPQALIPQSDSWQIDEQQIYRDRVVGYAEHLGPGIYEMHYLVRSVTPGDYRWPGAQAYLRDAPEQFGRTATAQLHIKG
jgi:alpha-2-macroglobulin